MSDIQLPLPRVDWNAHLKKILPFQKEVPIDIFLEISRFVFGQAATNSRSLCSFAVNWLTSTFTELENMIAQHDRLLSVFIYDAVPCISSAVGKGFISAAKWNEIMASYYLPFICRQEVAFSWRVFFLQTSVGVNDLPQELISGLDETSWIVLSSVIDQSTSIKKYLLLDLFDVGVKLLKLEFDNYDNYLQSLAVVPAILFGAAAIGRFTNEQKLSAFHKLFSLIYTQLAINGISDILVTAAVDLSVSAYDQSDLEPLLMSALDIAIANTSNHTDLLRWFEIVVWRLVHLWDKLLRSGLNKRAKFYSSFQAGTFEDCLTLITMRMKKCKEPVAVTYFLIEFVQSHTSLDYQAPSVSLATQSRTSTSLDECCLNN